MKKIIPILFFLPSLSVAWGDIDKKLKFMSTDIREVISVGTWAERKKEGYYRFIVVGGGIEHYKAKLFIQWVTSGSDMESPVILASIAIKEINGSPIYAFRLPKCIDKNSCSVITFIAEQTYTQEKYRFKIRLKGIGKYVFSKKKL